MNYLWKDSSISSTLGYFRCFCVLLFVALSFWPNVIFKQSGGQSFLIFSWLHDLMNSGASHGEVLNVFVVSLTLSDRHIVWGFGRV